MPGRREGRDEAGGTVWSTLRGRPDGAPGDAVGDGRRAYVRTVGDTVNRGRRAATRETVGDARRVSARTPGEAARVHARPDRGWG
jgi:hypothetical protein